MSDLIFKTNDEETFRISHPTIKTIGTKCPETKLEIKMTETDISKVLIEGEYATIMGIRYKRVEEPKPTTLWGVMRDELGFSIDMCDEIVDAVEGWLPKEHDTNSYKWNECLKLIRKNLR